MQGRQFTPEEDALVLIAGDQHRYGWLRDMAAGLDRHESVISARYLRLCDIRGAKTKNHRTKRKCLKCSKTFESEWIGNRMCKVCRYAGDTPFHTQMGRTSGAGSLK